MLQNSKIVNDLDLTVLQRFITNPASGANCELSFQKA
jgi:hypothetical protein